MIQICNNSGVEAIMSLSKDQFSFATDNNQIHFDIINILID